MITLDFRTNQGGGGGNYNPPIPISDVSGLQDALDATTYSPPIPQSDVTNLETDLASKYPETATIYNGTGGALADIILDENSTRTHIIRNFTGVAKVLMPADLDDGKRFQIYCANTVTYGDYVEVKDSTDNYILAKINNRSSCAFETNKYGAFGFTILPNKYVQPTSAETNNSTPYDAIFGDKQIVDFVGTENQLIRLPVVYSIAHQVEPTVPFCFINESNGVLTIKSNDETITYGTANPGETFVIYYLWNNWITFTDAKTLQAAKAYADNLVGTIDAADIISGTIDIARLPAAALERLAASPANQTARYALTTATVQNGDTVKQVDTGELWMVIDDANLSNSSGWQVYTAGTASAVAWSGVTSKPTNVTDIATATFANDDVVQKKSGALTNRTLSQFLADLGATVGSWSVLQTFNSLMLAIKGSSTGVTKLNSLNTSATNYQLDLPTKNGTVAIESQIPTFPMGEIAYFNTTGTTIVIPSQSDGSSNMVKVAVVTTGDFHFEMDNGGANNGRIRYTGSDTKSFHCAVSISVSPSTNNDEFVLGIAKNGTVDGDCKAIQKMGTTSDVQSTALHCMVELATNEYVELYIGNMTASRNIVVKALNIFTMGVINSSSIVNSSDFQNSYQTIASASTTNIGALKTQNVAISGTTTITAFDSVAAGITRYCRATGAFALTYNETSLILPSAANITCAADDRFTAISLGSGNWLVYNFQRADGTALKVGGVRILQEVVSTTGAYSTGSTTVPDDDTIPQITEGDQILSVSFTKQKASSLIMVTGILEVGANTDAALIASLYLSTQAGNDALASFKCGARVNTSLTTSSLPIALLQYSGVAAGSHNLLVRIGASSGSWYFNGVAGRKLGGALYSNVRITEYEINV